MIPPLAISIFYHKISRPCGCQRRAYRGSGSLDQCLHTGRWRLVTQHYGRQSPSSWGPRSRRHAVGRTGRRHAYLRWSWGRNSQPGLRPADPARKPSSLKGRRSERFEPPKPPPQWPRLQARGPRITEAAMAGDGLNRPQHPSSRTYRRRETGTYRPRRHRIGGPGPLSGASRFGNDR